MVHLPPLPGAPGFEGGRAAVREAARRDARRLERGGADAVLVENYGDAPYHPREVPAHVVAAVTDCVRTVREAVSVPVGANVLRTDARAALSAAAAAGGSFVRVNVHAGAAVTDQGTVEGRAHETLRLRERLDAPVAVLADVRVKHATPVDDRPVTAVARELFDRAGADGLVVSGPATGEPTDHRRLREVTDAVDAPVYVGSGVTADTVADALSIADGAIVGTALKQGGETTAPVDQERVARLVDAAEADDSPE
jgi:membrane complex biogenesis BtpA family protein